MAVANTYLNITETDFSDIRANLESYLSTQAQFQDYDFEGSAMSTLLDVLAYNTHYNAFYINMLANEMFLDTAQQRDSVVSRAKELGYLPVSAKGASANVTLTFTGVANTIGTFLISANSKFTTTIDDIGYTFVTPEDFVVQGVANTINPDVDDFIKEITIIEGEPLQHRFTVSSAAPIKYRLPNANVDTGSIKLRVQESAADATQTTFTKATNIVNVANNSPVYFLHESFDEKYEISFGDGVLGKAVKNNNIVIVDYRVCNGAMTNGSDVFSVGALSATADYTTVTLALKSKATGGRTQESISSIKFNAPKYYETQNRAIIAEDYSRILLNENSDLASVVSYGGEKRIPAVYGKVYIAVKPLQEDYITSERKTQLRLAIKDRTPLALDPVFVDAEYLYAIPTIEVLYDSKATVKTGDWFISKAKAALVTYNNNNLNQFNKRFRFSQFARSIDNVDVAIFNSAISMKIQKRFTPDTNVSQTVILDYKNSIRVSTVDSTSFTYNGFQAFLDDDGLGNINIYRYNTEKSKTNIVENAGTIVYNTGLITINNFAPTAYSGVEIKVTVTPENLDIVPTQETIIVLDSEAATITATSES
jgi:hypothetical protein